MDTVEEEAVPMVRKVNLTKRVETGSGRRYCPVVLSGNNKIKPDWVTVDGKEEKHSEGAYYIEWYESGRRRRESVGTNVATADKRREDKEWELEGVGRGKLQGPTEKKHHNLKQAVEDFLKEKEATRKRGTFLTYHYALRYFLESCKKENVEEVTRKDLLDYAIYLRNEVKRGPQTVHQDFALVEFFLKATGREKITTRADKPAFTPNDPDIYEKEDLEKMFAVCTEEERVLFSFFLMTGMREQEVAHCGWSDIRDGMIHVRYQAQFEWSPKTYQSRRIPVNPDLELLLEDWKKKRKPGSDLVFPKFGKPDPQFLPKLKKVAVRAGLDPARCWLHKFRSTAATRWLEAGFTLPTVQRWLGHRSLQATMRYLRDTRDPGIQDRMKGIF
jgi:integrase